jgi:hypothetical protein
MSDTSTKPSSSSAARGNVPRSSPKSASQHSMSASSCLVSKPPHRVGAGASGDVLGLFDEGAAVVIKYIRVVQGEVLLGREGQLQTRAAAVARGGVPGVIFSSPAALVMPWIPLMTGDFEALKLLRPFPAEFYGEARATLKRLHDEGITHRDLKPGNIAFQLTDGKPSPQLIDFLVKEGKDEALPKDRHNDKAALFKSMATMNLLQQSVGIYDPDNAKSITKAPVFNDEVVKVHGLMRQFRPCNKDGRWVVTGTEGHTFCGADWIVSSTSDPTLLSDPTVSVKQSEGLVQVSTDIDALLSVLCTTFRQGPSKELVLLVLGAVEGLQSKSLRIPFLTKESVCVRVNPQNGKMSVHLLLPVLRCECAAGESDSVRQVLQFLASCEPDAPPEATVPNWLASGNVPTTRGELLDAVRELPGYTFHPLWPRNVRSATTDAAPTVTATSTGRLDTLFQAAAIVEFSKMADTMSLSQQGEDSPWQWGAWTCGGEGQWEGEEEGKIPSTRLTRLTPASATASPTLTAGGGSSQQLLIDEGALSHSTDRSPDAVPSSHQFRMFKPLADAEALAYEAVKRLPYLNAMRAGWCDGLNAIRHVLALKRAYALSGLQPDGLHLRYVVGKGKDEPLAELGSPDRSVDVEKIFYVDSHAQAIFLIRYYEVRGHISLLTLCGEESKLPPVCFNVIWQPIEVEDLRSQMQKQQQENMALKEQVERMEEKQDRALKEQREQNIALKEQNIALKERMEQQDIALKEQREKQDRALKEQREQQNMTLQALMERMERMEEQNMALKEQLKEQQNMALKEEQ